MSPNSFRTVPVEPLVNDVGDAAGGTTPLEKAPSARAGAPAT